MAQVQIADGMEYALFAVVAEKARKDIIRWSEPATAKASAFEFFALVGGFIDETEATADDGNSDEDGDEICAAIERDIARSGNVGVGKGATETRGALWN